jgi:1-acyl-sn-glycerol-3-phosphate acyltransferase
MVIFRAARRSVLLIVHFLLGLLLTLAYGQRLNSDIVRTNPRVTTWWQNRSCDILGIQITVSGYRPKPPALLVSNHVSWLDIVVLNALTPTVFLSKSEVQRWPIIGWLATRAGTVFIRRGDGETHTVKAQIADRLHADELVTIFAEGTTTDGRQVRPFFPRLFAAAIETGKAVVPVALRYHVDGGFDPIAPYTDNQSLFDNFRGLIGRPYTRVHITFGAPINVEGLNRREAARRAHTAVQDALDAPRPLTGTT